MTCPYSNLIGAYHDGELPPAQVNEMESHLAQCPRCQADLEQVRRLSGRIRSARLAAPSADAVERWASDFVGMRDRGVRRLASWMTAAAAMLMVAVGLFTLADHRTVAAPILLGPADTVALVPEGDAAPKTIVAAEWMATDLAGGIADARRRP